MLCRNTLIAPRDNSSLQDRGSFCACAYLGKYIIGVRINPTNS